MKSSANIPLKAIPINPHIAPMPIFQCDATGFCFYHNPVAEQLLSSWFASGGSQLPARLVQAIQDLDKNEVDEPGPFSVELTIGESQWRFDGVREKLTRHVTFFATALSQGADDYQQKLARLEHYDPLTQLPNRKYFIGYLDECLTHSLTEQSIGAMLHIQIERLRLIYQTLGLQVVDGLIQLLSERIRHCLRHHDLLARIADTEFAVVVKSIAEIGDLNVLAERILATLKEACFVDGHELRVAANLGISIFPNDAQQAAQVMSNASLALTRAHALGDDGYYFYRRYLRSAAKQTQQLSKDLVHALKRNEFFLQYQPIHDLATGRLISAEALIRWQHSHYELLTPDRFIGLAEELGLMDEIGAWLLDAACAFGKTLQTSLQQSLPIAINISPVQFRQLTFADKVLDVLEHHQLPSASLILEITEHVVIANIAFAKHLLQNLRSHGVVIAIDDFGTGYSSLSYLSQLPADKLKIDRSFIMDVHQNPEHGSIVRSVIDIGHKLGMQVIAEGIEDESQVALLKAQCCDLGQGFYFSKALSADAFLAYAQSHINTDIENQGDK